MTPVFRAYSPSRDKGGSPTCDLPYAVGDAAVRNQAVLVHATLPDWTVQAGTIRWETT